MLIDEFLKRLDNLTPHGAGFKPHKYLLLLTILDLLEGQQVPKNEFPFDARMRHKFTSYFRQYAGENDRNRPCAPFFHLGSSGFWHLRALPGRERELANLTTVGGPRELVENVDYGYLSDAVFDLLSNRSVAAMVRERIKTILTTERCLEDRREARESRSAYEEEEGQPSIFAHEERAIRAIRNAIGRGRVLLTNLELRDRQSNNYFEYDAVLLTYAGILVVELKHWSGHIQILPYSWIIDSYRYRRDPHLSNGYKCKLLKGLYEHEFPTFPSLWVESVVVLTNPEAAVEGADSPSAAAVGNRHNLTLASIDDFLSYIKKREASPENRVLSDGEITAVASFLQRLSSGPRRAGYVVPGYETVRYLAQRPECIELIARPIDGRTRGLNRFRVFRVPAQATAEERKRALRKAYNTLEVVSKIGDHPNIHKVWVVGSEEGDIIEGSDWSEAGTLKDFLVARAGPVPPDEALRICHGLALALAAAHDAGIIHRAVKPKHVLMMNGVPKLTDFDLSFQLEEKRDVTVIPSSSVLKDDGYTAPELLEGKDIDEGTDLFSLGVIAYELLTGEKPFATARQLVALGGQLNDKQVGRLTATGISEKVATAIASAIVADRRSRLRDAWRMVDVLGSVIDSSVEEATRVPNAILEPGSRYDVYEILAFLGQGAEAQTYQARTIRGELVALKLFNQEIPRERIFQQQAAASSVVSPHVVRCDGRMGHWQNERYFLVMEYVDGESLRAEIDRGGRPDRESFQRVALGLLEGLAAFHGRRDEDGELAPLIHGDVKPDNILLTRNGEPKLADFSVAGPPRIDGFQGTVGYVPPDRILGEQMQFAADGDLFALGVSLWEWTFGRKPYENVVIDARAELPNTDDCPLSQAQLSWLRKAVATTEADRFASVEEMREALVSGSVGVVEQEVMPEVTPEVPAEKDVRGEEGFTAEPSTAMIALAAAAGNRFVCYLNSLSSASAGNENATAEAQTSNPLFERIRVPNKLARLLFNKLVEERQSVILTGNAGDGKTTIAAEVYQRLTRQPMPVNRRVEVFDKGVVIVKDMSELPAAERAQVLAEAARSQERVYLIVSNTGTLLESARHLSLDGIEPHELRSQLLTALESDEVTPILNGRLHLLNVGRSDSIDTACEVFRRMMEAENWGECQACDLSGRCPIFTNVLLVQDNKDVVLRRTELAYRRLYEYGVRLTMRQMTGHLAYALTAGRDCADIRRLSDIALADCLTGSLFFNRFFGDDGQQSPPEAAQLLAVKHVRDSEFGVMLDPEFERSLWGRDTGTVRLKGAALVQYKKLKGDSDAPNAAARRQVRRLVYFMGLMDGEDEKRYVSMFLRSPMLIDYLTITTSSQGVPPMLETQWRCQVMQVLQEHFGGVRLPEGSWKTTSRLYVTLNPRSSGTATQIVLASFATEDCQLAVEAGHHAVESGRGRLQLRWRNGLAKMELDLPFLDYVAQRYEGEMAAQLSAHYADRLERFKASLLEASAGSTDQSELQLLRIGADRQFKPLRIHFYGDHLEVV